MKNKKIPLFKVFTDKKKAQSIVGQVLDSGFLNEGIYVNKLSKKLKNFLNVKNIVLMNSCTSALTIAMKLSGLEPGKNIVTTPVTCIASNTPIKNLGGKVKWADVDTETGMLSQETIKKAIDKSTVAVLIVNWSGVVPDLKKIYNFCTKKKVKLIIDGAHSFSAKLNKKDVSYYSDFTCLSFQAIKHFTCGDGGALICKNDNDHNKAEKLKWFGFDRKQAKDEKGNWIQQQRNIDIESSLIGYKFNMNNIAAAIGLSNMPHIRKILKKHIDNANTYKKQFTKSKHIKFIKEVKNSNSVYWYYTIILSSKRIRNDLEKHLLKKNIDCGQVHVPNDIYSCFKSSEIDLPGVRFFSEHQLSLPCGWWISKKEIENIAKTITAFTKSFK